MTYDDLDELGCDEFGGVPPAEYNRRDERDILNEALERGIKLKQEDENC